MNEYMPDRISPPGDTLAEILDERQMTQAQFAERISRTPKFVNEVVKGKAPITPSVAIEFQRVLGTPSSFWNNRQRQYDAYLAGVRESENLVKHLDWARNFPYNGMSKWRWVPETKEKLSRLANILDFFGVANPAAWESVWGGFAVEFRKSEKREADRFALAAWLRKGELAAQGIDCAPYDRTRFQETLAEIKSLTVKGPDQFVPSLTTMCSSCGVAVAFVPELPKTASGATRWLSPNKALIQLSLRYRSDDQLWFTFFHEAAHILFHRKKLIFIEIEPYKSEQECEADKFAADCLIPPADFNSFVEERTGRAFSKRSILEFAHRLGISPGIVVGRLQHEKLLKHSHCNDLKKKLEWVHPENR